MTAKIPKERTTRRPGQTRRIADFRQSEQYYNVVFEAFAHPGVTILARGSDDDDASTTKWAAKRRRIEEMAADFLRGKPLYIPSVRPCPTALEAYVGWNKRTSSEPNFHIDSISRPEACDRIWDDVEDHNDVLERLRKNEANRSRRRDPSPYPDVRVEEVAGRSACKRRASAKAPKVSTALRRTATDAATPIRHEASTSVTNNVQNADSDTLNGQLKNPAKRLEHGVVANGQGRCIVDSFEGIKMADMPAANGYNKTEALQENETSATDDALHALEAPDKDPDSNRGLDHSYHTAPEPTEVPTVLLSQIPEVLPTEDSQDQLLRQQGIQVKPRKSWAPMNETAGGVDKQNTEPTFDESEAHTEPTISLRDMLLGSAQNHAGQRKSTRRRKNSSVDENQPTPNINGTALGQTESQNAVDPDLPVDMQRCMGAFRPLYTTAAETQSGTTPMQYRPRHSNTIADENVAATAVSKKQRRRVDFSSPRMRGNRARKPGNAPSTIAAPQLEISLGPGSPFGPGLNLALEHGPAAVDPARSAALHMPASDRAGEPSKESEAQVELAQADTSFIARETKDTDPHSVQGHPTAIAATESLSRKSGCLSNFWPGTQAALDQAELTLFNSPEKPADENSEGQTEAASAFQKPEQASGSGAKPSSQRPSPEKLPSTQQLIDGFGGFSTIKKPRANRRKSVEPTPACKGRALHSFNMEESWDFSNLVTPAHEFDKTSSNLRCPDDDDLDFTSYLQAQRTPRASKTHRSSGQTTIGEDDSQSSAQDTTRLKETPTITSGRGPSALRHGISQDSTLLLADAMTEAISSDAPLPSHQCAQRSQEKMDNFAIAEELVRDVFGQSL